MTTTHSNPNFRAAKNTLNRQFNITQPDRAWVTDVTYVDTARGWLYVAAVLDLYSRKVVGWAGSPHLHVEVAIEALHRAITERHPPPGLLVHSDRGSQYTSDIYQRFLRQYGMQCSMSRSGNCWDNAVMERFFLSLKKECVWRQRYANREEAIKDIGHYIHNFYNPVRLHSTLGYLAPDVYEKTQAKNTPPKLSTKT